MAFEKQPALIQGRDGWGVGEGYGVRCNACDRRHDYAYPSVSQAASRVTESGWSVSARTNRRGVPSVRANSQVLCPKCTDNHNKENNK